MGNLIEAPQAPSLKPGSTIGGYEIVGTAGEGGMGKVYRARHIQLGRTVALKVLSHTYASDPQFIERFRREAKALATLSHPNIVGVYDFGVEAGLPYLAMEFVEGVSLRKLLSERRLPPEEAFQIVPQLCDALEFAHAAGIVHRDVKPENILIDRTGTVKIADFGLAKMVDSGSSGSLTMTNVSMGTPHYMAPEQFENFRGVDHRADIYSMGVVFYEMLTGELPMGRFHVPSRKARVNSRLDEIVMKTLEKEPAERYQRAREVKNDLTTANVQLPPPERIVVHAKANGPWWIVLLVVVVLLAVSCGGTVLLWFVTMAPMKHEMHDGAPIAPAPAPIAPPAVIPDDGTRDVLALKKLIAEDGTFRLYDDVELHAKNAVRRWPDRSHEICTLWEEHEKRYESTASERAAIVKEQARALVETKKFAEAIRSIDTFPKELRRSAAWKELTTLADEIQLMKKR